MILGAPAATRTSTPLDTGCRADVPMPAADAPHCAVSGWRGNASRPDRLLNPHLEYPGAGVAVGGVNADAYAPRFRAVQPVPPEALVIAAHLRNLIPIGQHRIIPHGFGVRLGPPVPAQRRIECYLNETDTLRLPQVQLDPLRHGLGRVGPPLIGAFLCSARDTIDDRLGRNTLR